jgi:ATP/maltotriose-dependent transcriptional regulator MalT
LRSWIAAEGLEDRTAWVSVGRREHDAQTFWPSVLDSLRRTRIGSERVRELTAAPDLDGATFVTRLLEDLASLGERLWLVIDDLHELRAEEAIRQVELLLASAPPELRLVLLTRRDVRLGLHRLRVEGELTELRGEELRFSLGESRELLEAAGLRLSDGAVESLIATTEGWAGGLRLAALSLARDPDPERLAASFSGRQRAVADYLLAEVLERHPEQVTRLVLRTSILERVSGPLADRLTGDSGSERILLELEDAGAFLVSLEAERTWFRYHRLFAHLLAVELRRTAPQELPGLHTIAAEWLADHGHPVEAIRHAQAAEDRGMRAGCSRTTGSSWTSMAGWRPPVSCCPGFQPARSRGTPSWRRSPRATGGRRGPCTRPSGIWRLRSASRSRCPSSAGGTSRSRSCSCGCRSCEPATIWTLSPKRRSERSPWPTVDTRPRRGLATRACGQRRSSTSAPPRYGRDN